MYRVEQSSFRVIIAGDRNWSDLDIERKIRQLLLLLQLPRDPQGNWNVEIVHGACSGVDQTAGRIARELGFIVTEFPADWQKYGRAGTRRCSITSAREAAGSTSFTSGSMSRRERRTCWTRPRQREFLIFSSTDERTRTPYRERARGMISIRNSVVIKRVSSYLKSNGSSPLVSGCSEEAQLP